MPSKPSISRAGWELGARQRHRLNILTSKVSLSYHWVDIRKALKLHE